MIDALSLRQHAQQTFRLALAIDDTEAQAQLEAFGNELVAQAGKIERAGTREDLLTSLPACPEAQLQGKEEPARSRFRFLRMPGIQDVLQRLYDSEINCAISWLWDGGVDWRLGDGLNGWKAEGSARTVPAALSELADVAAAAYPESSFTAWWMTQRVG